MPYYPYAPAVSDIYSLFDYQISNSVRAVFNDPSDQDYVGMLTDITGLDSPEVRDSGDVLVAADGGYSGINYYGRRPITMTGTIFGHADIPSRNIRMSRLRKAANSMISDGIMIWKPSWGVPQNLVNNGNFETDLQSWDTTNAASAGFLLDGATIARSTAQHNTDAASMQVTVTTALGAEGTSINLGLLPKGAYAASVWVKGALGGELLQLVGGPVGTSSTTPFVASTSWTKQTVVWLASGSAPSYLVLRQGTAAPQTYYVDSAIAVPGGVPPTSYYDGDTSGYWWWGTPRNSPSANYIAMYVPVRRQQPLRFTGAWNKDFQALMVSQFAPMFSAATTVSPVSAGPLIVENQGDYAAFPIIRIFGPTSGTLYVTVGTSTICRMLPAYTIASGHYIDIDVLNHTVIRDGTINDNANVDWPLTSWSPFAPGLNTLNLTSGTMRATFRSAWI